YGPKSSGRSRHGAPDRKTQKMPLRTRRSFTRGTPRGLFGNIGLMAAHSPSVSSQRMMRSFRFRGLNDVKAALLRHDASFSRTDSVLSGNRRGDGSQAIEDRGHQRIERDH